MTDQDKYMSYIRYWPIPACIIGEDGVILATIKTFDEIFKEDLLVGKSLSDLMEIPLKTIKQGGAEKPVQFITKDSNYKVIAKAIEEGSVPYTIVSLKDITALENLKILYNEARDALAVVQIDNYEELFQGTSEENRATLFSSMDKVIRSWGSKMDASVTKIGEIGRAHV